MHGRLFGFPPAILIPGLVLVGWTGTPRPASPEIITFSGTVRYQGSHEGDTLFVAVLDTTGAEDVSILAIDRYAVDAPPFDQPYSLDFDNTGVGAFLIVASFLDVGGGGIDSLGGEDVFGWYGESGGPAGIPSGGSQAGLDFSLPRAEIHGTLTLVAGQAEAWVDVSNDPSCNLEGFRPRHYQSVSGPYRVNGLYPGAYCVIGGGYVPMVEPNLRICYGDPACLSPSLITLSETEVRTGVDLDFHDAVPSRTSTWGRLKVRYR